MFADSPLEAWNTVEGAVCAALLGSTVSQLRAEVTSGACGVLLAGGDWVSWRAIMAAVDPSVAPVSCYGVVAGIGLREVGSGPLLWLSDVDAVGEGVEGAVKAVFARDVGSPMDRVVVASAGVESRVPVSLRRAGRLERVVRVDSGDLSARAAAWAAALGALFLIVGNVDIEMEQKAIELAAVSPGFGLGDFRRALLMYHAGVSSGQQSDESAGTHRRGRSLEYLMECVRAMKPLGYGNSDQRTELDCIGSGATEDMLHAGKQGAEAAWNAFGGYSATKEQILHLCEWPVLHSATFRRLGVDAPRGLLLHGPHGCGKTMLAIALLRRLRHANWLHVNAPELFSKYLGDSEARVRSLFHRAQSLAPCVVFIDELEAVGGQREGERDAGGSGVERRVLGALLTELDGASDGKVFVLACTSSLESIDAALVRPGRIDHVIEIGRPSLEDRVAILDIILGKMPVADDCVDTIQIIAQSTHGMTGADLERLCREAAMIAMDETEEPEVIRTQHLLLARDRAQTWLPWDLG